VEMWLHSRHGTALQIAISAGVLGKCLDAAIGQGSVADLRQKLSLAGDVPCHVSAGG